MGLCVVGVTEQVVEIRVYPGPKDLFLCTALQTFIHQFSISISFSLKSQTTTPNIFHL